MKANTKSDKTDEKDLKKTLEILKILKENLLKVKEDLKVKMEKNKDK